jgi:uncharacterized membrane protein YoaK (UPF0700 family)
VQLGIAATHADAGRALNNLPPLLAFFAGALTIRGLSRQRALQLVGRPGRVIPVLGILVLAGVGLIPASAPDLPVTALVAFMASTVATPRFLTDGASSETVTQNEPLTVARKNGSAVAAYPDSTRLTGRFAAVIAAYALGALGEWRLTIALGPPAAWAPAALLAAALLLTRRRRSQLGRHQPRILDGLLETLHSMSSPAADSERRVGLSTRDRSEDA